MGGESKIEYASLLNDAVSISDVSTALYPVVDVKEFLPVVKKLVCNDVTKVFQYGGLKFHSQGLGLLGFEKTLVKNETSGEVTSNIIDAWDPTYFVPRKTTTMTNVDSFCKSVINENSVVPKNGTYFTFPAKQVSSDYDGNLTTVVNQYNLDDGYITLQKVLYDSEAMYKQIAYNSYVYKNGTYYPSEIVKTQKHEDDEAEYTQKSTYIYDEFGQITKEISFAGTSLELTKDYLYDQFGNVVSTTQSGYAISPVTHLYDYDSTGRFLIKSWQNPEGEMLCYTNDLWGNVLTSTDLTNSEHALQTTYQYDKWGKLLKTIYPTGVVETYRIEWANTSGERYCVEKECEGKPTLKTWYDYKGQKVHLEYPSLNNVVHTKRIMYDALRLVSGDVEIIGKQVYYEAFSYDKLQRMVDKKQYNKDRFYHYTYGNRCVTTTIGNQSYVKSTDAWGNVKNVTDPVGSVSYKYNSMGKPIEVNSNGATVSLEYDEVGNRISLTDPDAGTIRSEYAADGNLLKQTDARGIVTANSYDELGRLTFSKIGETEISHVYGTSGNEKLRLVKSMSNGNIEEYTHDEFGRLTSKTRTVHDGNVLKYTYSYDDKDRLIGQTYPGGLKQTYCYDENGYKVRNFVNGILVSSLVNFDGKTSQIKLLDNLVVQDVELDNGGRIATNRMAVSGKDIFNMQCKYDSKTGNLLSRSGVNDEQEIFEYDEADRLLSVKNGDKIVLDVKYSENGNIVCKSDVGNYVYGSKPHAVMSVDNINGIIPSASLMTKFNSLGKIDRIADGNTLRSLDFSYGPDGQRWTTSLEINGNFVPIITYGDNYEKVITNNSITREFYYVDDYVMFVRTNQTRDFVPLLMTKDNLGSVLSIYNTKMNKIFDASYDAWGKQTVSTNLLGFVRGYSGHEMLNNFDIVNMNGRLYDPVLGRFLSPDNYVQMPDNSQNFNRYSYCLNNPMKYTDPSGEFFVFTFFNAVCDLVSNPIKHGFNVSRYNWKKTTNAFKIDMGLFKGSFVQILSRFTWESFQTSLGHLYSHGRNIFSSVDAVEYFGGATYLIDKNHKKNNGVTIGPYININSTDEIPRDEYGNFAPYKNYLYMHEYGHYLQSQEYGFGYIFTVGIPSLYNTSKKEIVKVIDNDTGNPTYYSKVKTMWFERHANEKASKYFKKKYNILKFRK